MKHKLGITGVFRQHQRAGGVYSVFRNLLLGFEQARRECPEWAELDVSVFWGGGEAPPEAQPFTIRPAPVAKNRFVSESLVGGGASRGLDALLYPNYHLPPVSRANRNVVILHDLQFRRFPEMFSARKRWWLDRAVQHSLKRADRVVTISQAVKQDVLRVYGDRYEERLAPIWNPINLKRFSGDQRSSIVGDRPYLLGVAIDRPLKNLVTLVRAFAALSDRRSDLQLVLVGQLRSEGSKKRRWHGSSGATAVGEVAAQLGIHDRVHVTGFVSDQELGALYRGASLFVLPSLFEGFGMPPVEAMSLGTPALVSDIPVLREVTLDQAHYIPDPKDADALADQIEGLLTAGPAIRPGADLSERLIQEFSAKTIACRYLDVLLN